MADEPERRRGGPPALALALLVGSTACGVAGRPLPPGPAPPAAPTPAAPVSTPDGAELSLAEPLRDIDGAPVGEGELWVHPADDCAGAPLARGPLEGVLVPRARLGGPLRLVAVRAGRAGPPSAPLTVAWTAPPPPPEAPLAFVDAGGRVQLSWLPPGPPVTEVEIRRDGEAVAIAPAEAALWSEQPGAGRYRYAIVGLAPGLRTGSSEAAAVIVP